MENRIQINGTWYVKEDTTNIQPETSKFDAALATHFEGYVYETTDYCWEATRIYKDKEFHNGVSIKFANKKTEEVEYWDNERWMKEVLHNDKKRIKRSSHKYE